jgi:hypothetical protein
MNPVTELQQHLGEAVPDGRAVSGKKECCMVVVLQYGMKNFTVFPLVADITGMHTRPWTARYIIITFALARRSAGDSLPSFVIICVTLLVLR